MTEPTSLDLVEREIAPQTQSLASSVASLVIASPAQEQAASDLLGVAQEGIRQIKAKCKDSVDAAHAAHKKAVALRDGMLAPWQDAEAKIKRLLGDYRREVERRQEEQRKLLEAEAKRRQEEELATLAADLEREGKNEEAQAVFEEALTAPVVAPPPPPVPRASGVSYRKEYDFEVISVGSLAPSYLLPHDTAIRSIVKRMGPQAVQVVTKPGSPAAIRIYEKTTVAGRR